MRPSYFTIVTIRWRQWKTVFSLAQSFSEYRNLSLSASLSYLSLRWSRWSLLQRAGILTPQIIQKQIPFNQTMWSKSSAPWLHKKLWVKACGKTVTKHRTLWGGKAPAAHSTGRVRDRALGGAILVNIVIQQSSRWPRVCAQWKIIRLERRQRVRRRSTRIRKHFRCRRKWLSLRRSVWYAEQWKMKTEGLVSFPIALAQNHQETKDYWKN